MSLPEPVPVEISQRDLRHRSAEIMDALETGISFAITRRGLHIGNLVPARRRRTFVSRTEFAARSTRKPMIDAEAFRADLEHHVDGEASDPYDRAYRRGTSRSEDEE